MLSIINKFKILTYNIGFVKKPISDIISDGFKKNDIVWLKHNYKDRFFADPFMLKIDDKYYYLLVEEFIFWEEKGKIVLLTVDKTDFQLKERKLILEEDYHLSFPFCKLGCNYFIPESINGDGTYKYILDSEFNVVEKEKVYEEGLIDAIFFKDKILASKKVNPKNDLYILDANEYKKSQSIYSDIRYTRSAGDMFYYNGDLIRPVQDSEGRYGRQMHLLKIKNLNAGYEFEDLCVLNSFDNPPYDETCHTFNHYDEITIIDGSKDFIRFPTKLIYKIRKKMKLWKRK